ncbi:N-acetyltransferase [Streptomyces spiroverticillatus]|nr:N-acetyltransferase [Streptomyces spiroverticillatus]
MRRGPEPYRTAMNSTTVRPATPDDVPAVKTVTDAAYGHYVERIGRPPVPMLADHAANVAAGRVFVVGEPVHGVLVLVPEPDHLFLDSIAVRPDMAGKGVGRELLGFVDAYAHELGLPEIRLYTNALMWENQKIYPRYGYEMVERRLDEGIYDRFHYRKRIAD